MRCCLPGLNHWRPPSLPDAVTDKPPRNERQECKRNDCRPAREDADSNRESDEEEQSNAEKKDVALSSPRLCEEWRKSCGQYRFPTDMLSITHHGASAAIITEPATDPRRAIRITRTGIAGIRTALPVVARFASLHNAIPTGRTGRTGVAAPIVVVPKAGSSGAIRVFRTDEPTLRTTQIIAALPIITLFMLFHFPITTEWRGTFRCIWTRLHRAGAVHTLPTIRRGAPSTAIPTENRIGIIAIGIHETGLPVDATVCRRCFLLLTGCITAIITIGGARSPGTIDIRVCPGFRAGHPIGCPPIALSPVIALLQAFALSVAAERLHFTDGGASITSLRGTGAASTEEGRRHLCTRGNTIRTLASIVTLLTLGYRGDRISTDCLVTLVRAGIVIHIIPVI